MGVVVIFSIDFLGETTGVAKPFRLGLRWTCTGEGIGGDWGRDLMGDMTASGTSRGRDRERERDLVRYGRNLGTCRYWVLEVAMA
jgi:hypothetical protein